jgi:hypothetical protein
MGMGEEDLNWGIEAYYSLPIEFLV